MVTRGVSGQTAEDRRKTTFLFPLSREFAGIYSGGPFFLRIRYVDDDGTDRGFALIHH